MKDIGDVKDRFFSYIVNVTLCLGAVVMICFYVSGIVTAAQSKEERHLMQTTNYQDEYEGMLYLDLLRIYPLDEPDVDQVYERVAPAIVRITMGDYVGSGIVIGLSPNKVTILSNKHLLQNAGDGMVSFRQGFEVSGTVSEYSEQYDMALLEVAIKDIPYEQLAELRYVTRKQVTYDSVFIIDESENTGAVMTGDPVVLIGSADKAAGDMDIGTVRNPSAFHLDFYTEMMEVNAKAEPGMSGGIVCDGYGRMIGMITGNSLTDETCVYCLPVEKIELE